LHDAAAGGVGEGRKHARDLLLIVNHGVKYNARAPDVKEIVNAAVKYVGLAAHLRSDTRPRSKTQPGKRQSRSLDFEARRRFATEAKTRASSLGMTVVGRQRRNRTEISANSIEVPS